jgi:hypothetical protein
MPQSSSRDAPGAAVDRAPPRSAGRSARVAESEQIFANAVHETADAIFGTSID